jgi:large conductance mechanosensitive channel
MGGTFVLAEFKKFIMRGNVLDLAVGIIVGGAFGKIVSSFVADILMPPLGLIMGKVNFSDLFLNLSATNYPTLAAAKAAGAPTVNYGLFINTIIDFLIVSFAIYLLIAQVNRMQKKPEAAPPTTKECPFCISAVPIKAVRCPQCTSNLE